MKQTDILKNIPKKSDQTKNTRNCMVSGSLNQEHHTVLKRYCALHDITMSSLVREVMIYFIENVETNE